MVTSIEGVGLTDTLSGPGPFTAFAPVSAAFDILPDALLECLINQQTILTDILLYHVVSGTVLSTDLTDGMTATTLEGSELTFAVSDKVVINGNVNVTQTDIIATNGVVHVIDSRK